VGTAFSPHVRATLDGVWFRLSFEAQPSGPARFRCAGPRTSETITNVFRNRRFACLFLGLWLGAAVSVDFLVAENFSTIDPFLTALGSPLVTARIKQAGQQSVRFILRRNAAEENGRIFEVWEWTQIGMATLFFFLVMFGERPPLSALILIAAMFVLILIQHFILTPNVVSLGREVDEIPLTEQLRNPTVDRFWVFHGFYSGFEILKLLLGMGVAARLMIRRTPDLTENKSERLSESEVEPRKRRRHSTQNG
jgi:hypothetical protein